MCLVSTGHAFSCFLSQKSSCYSTTLPLTILENGKWIKVGPDVPPRQSFCLQYDQFLFVPNGYGRKAILTEFSLLIHAHPLDDILEEWIGVFSNNEHAWTSGIHEFFHYFHVISNIFQNEQQVVALRFQYHQWEVEIHCYQTVLSYLTNCNHLKIKQWKTITSIPFDEMLNCGESTWISLSIPFFCNTTMTNNPLVYLRSIFRVDSNSWSCSAFGTTFSVARQLGL